MSEENTTKAIVAFGEHDWRMEEVTVRDIREDELLVQIVATGICHTDVVGVGAGFPRVLGHEGSGYVKKAGAKVTVAKPGDPVLLSFASCTSCDVCQSGHPAYCDAFVPLNIMNYEDRVFSGTSGGEKVRYPGIYFGQSSFANLTVVKECSVVNAKELIRDEEDLKQFAPLGCGIQTGSGAIVNVAKATPKDSVVVLGLGGVGQSAIMAAKMLGCQTIVGVDLVDWRIELAKSFGATRGINSKFIPEGKTLVDEIKEITSGRGASVVIDTTGSSAVFSQVLQFTRSAARIIFMGVSPPGTKLEIDDPNAHVISGKQLLAVVEGDAIPAKYVPQLVSWFRKGLLPIDKMTKYFAAADFQKARQSMEKGETIKPILVW